MVPKQDYLGFRARERVRRQHRRVHNGEHGARFGSMGGRIYPVALGAKKMIPCCLSDRSYKRCSFLGCLGRSCYWQLDVDRDCIEVLVLVRLVQAHRFGRGLTLGSEVPEDHLLVMGLGWKLEILYVVLINEKCRSYLPWR